MCSPGTGNTGKSALESLCTIPEHSVEGPQNIILSYNTVTYFKFKNTHTAINWDSGMFFVTNNRKRITSKTLRKLVSLLIYVESTLMLNLKQ